jgi:hypothetical protein
MPDLLMPRLTPARTIRRGGWLDGGPTNRESGEAWRSTYSNAEQMELIGVIKRWTRYAYSVLVREAKSIDNHLLDLFWCIVVREFKVPKQRGKGLIVNFVE